MTDEPEAPNELFSDEEIEILLATPPETIIGNHVFHLLELAALHLSTDPPQLAEAQLAIDAVAGLMEAVSDRLNDHGPLLGEALSQIQMAFVAVSQSLRDESAAQETDSTS